MNLVVASPTGLCFGVRRAIGQLEAALAEYGSICALGSPIHNPQEVRRLQSSGLQVVEEVSVIPEGVVVFIRAHGISPFELAEVKKKCPVVVDGTCPFVRNVQRGRSRSTGKGIKS